jgi:hypothetical protein
MYLCLRRKVKAIVGLIFSQIHSRVTAMRQIVGASGQMSGDIGLTDSSGQNEAAKALSPRIERCEPILASKQHKNREATMV